LSAPDLAAWQAAVEEYRAKQGVPIASVNYPIGTDAFYGPDDKITTKIAVAVIVHEDAEPILKRWVGTNVTSNAKVQRELQAFFQQHGVQSVRMSDGNMGCPHKGGEDFPVGEDCPFWQGQTGEQSTRWSVKCYCTEPGERAGPRHVRPDRQRALRSRQSACRFQRHLHIGRRYLFQHIQRAGDSRRPLPSQMRINHGRFQTVEGVKAVRT
jgi:hypothetical protein